MGCEGEDRVNLPAARLFTNCAATIARSPKNPPDRRFPKFMPLIVAEVENGHSVVVHLPRAQDGKGLPYSNDLERSTRMTGWRVAWLGIILFSSGRKRLDPLYATKGAPVKNESNATDMKTEIELVDLAQQGDMHAFSALFNAHKARIYSLCLRLTGSRSEAEELTEGAFLHAFRHLDGSTGKDFSVWIYRTAVDMVVAQRRKGRLGVLSIDRLVKLADQSICPTRRPARFSRMRSSVRSLRLHVSATCSWTSVMSTLGRACRAVRAIS
jgi:hypothetical protein